MIKALIFDYGGIFSGGSFRPFVEKYAKIYGKDADSFHEILRKSWDEARINKITSADFWNEIAGFLGANPKKIRTECIRFFGFNSEMRTFVKALKGKYKLALLSNQIKDWLEEMLDTHRMRELFDVIVTSYNTGIAKPDIRIFEETVKQIGVEPTECVYIDDMQKNIPPARSMGMHTILFKDLEQLNIELEKVESWSGQ